MATFIKKYGVDANFAAEFLTLGTNTTNLIDAMEVADASEEYQQIIQDEFGSDYVTVIMDCVTQLTTGTIEVKSPFEAV